MISGKKILIVEDSRTIRLQIKMMLKDQGAILVDAGSEWGMNTKIEEYGIVADLIIMDLILNYENGLELIHKLKQTPKYKDIPIIIITEKVDVASILKARDLGVKSYLRKPIKKADLISRISDALEKTESL
jgi:PleD family two-component response regulator